jgi:flagellar basal body rod protein FlgG
VRPTFDQTLRTAVDPTLGPVKVDFDSGTISPTGRALDFAIDGPGFFVVDTPNGERLTRGGSFQLDASRRLVDGSGHPVLGDAGPITVPDGAIEIDAKGALSVDGKVVDRLRLERPGKGAELAHEGGTLFVPDAAREPVADADRGVRQGFVEESNVSTVGSMVDMIAVQRAYASVQKAVTTIDAIRGTAANELGKPV